MGQIAGGWNTMKLLQSWHDAAGGASGGASGAMASSAALSAAMLKPISWTSSSVAITTLQVF